MKFFIVVIGLMIGSFAYAQKDTSFLLEAIKKLENALVNKDQQTANTLIHPDVQFGHSNGWVQNKIDVANDMRTGFLIYKKIDNQSIIIDIKKKKGFVKEVIEVEGTRNGTDFKMKLFVQQLWVQTKKGWQLLIRQSTRLT